MTTDTKAVTRYRAILSHGLIEVEAHPVGSLVTFTDHERVVGELRSTMFAMNEKHFSDFNKLGELLKHRDRELAASRAEVEGLKKDADRYRWLREVYDPSIHDEGFEPLFSLGPDNLDTEIDALIDAAMEKGNV